MTRTQRSYDHFCAVALALDQIGERWALLVVRELLSGPKRFVDLLQGMPGVATNTLTTRLEELETAGLIAKRQLPPPAASVVYELTARGRELEPVLLALVRFGHRSIQAARADPSRAAELAPVRAGWLAVSLRAYFVPPTPTLAARVQLGLPTGALGIVIDDDTLTITNGSIEGPDATLSTTEDGLLALLTGAVKLSAAKRQKMAAVEGDTALLEQVLACFRLRAPGP